MATQIIINLNDAEEAALKGGLQYVDGVTKEPFNEIVEEYLRIQCLDGLMKGYIATEEIKKIEPIIQTKTSEVEYKKPIVEEPKEITK